MNDLYAERVLAMRRSLEGEEPSHIYTSLGRSQAWFFKWKLRYAHYGLEGLKDISKAPHQQADQIPETLEPAIVNIRQARENRERDETHYALIGALAIRKELVELGYDPPCVKTRHNILARHGPISPIPPAQSAREVIDRHYPTLTMTRPGHVQQLDLVGSRYLHGSSQKYYFYTMRDTCSRRVAIEVGKDHQARTIVNALIHAWQRMGKPTILQHDNALEFRGSNHSPRSAGLLTRLCLALQIESVFIPGHEPYRNGSIENFNGLLQRLVLKTQEIDAFPSLQEEVRRFELAANTTHPHAPLHGQTSAEYEHAVHFQPNLLAPSYTFPARFHFEALPEGKVSFICRIRKSGKITIATEKFEIDPTLAWDYVYASIFVKERRLRIYHQGKVLKELPYMLKV